MKNIKKFTLAATFAGALISTTVEAELNDNIGVVSQYYFRGVQQTSGASASAGVDYEHATGAYVGIWAADVSSGQTSPDAKGIEYDTYGGYKGEAGNIAYGVGFTGYYYTGGFDTSYEEINLSAGYKSFAVEFNTGSHEVTGAADHNYIFTAISYEHGDFEFAYGIWGNDFAGAYTQLAYAKTVTKIDLGVLLINGNKKANPRANSANIITGGYALVFSIGKTFNL